MDDSVGRKDDKGKSRLGLLPWFALVEVGHVLRVGAQKYDEHNWLKVPNARSRYFDAALRHLAAWGSGERLDSESGLHHLAHAACSVLFVLALDLEAKDAADR